MNDLSESVHPALQALLDVDGGPQPSTPAEVRAAFEDAIAEIDQPGPAMAEEIDCVMSTPTGDLAGKLFRPAGMQTAAPALIFFHGGGWNKGSINTHASLCRFLADSGKFSVVSCEYRLTPEHVYPCAFNDATAWIEWIFQNASILEIDIARIGVGGDSAGGNLAAAGCLTPTELESQRIRAQLLLYPVLDLRQNSNYASREAFRKGYWLDEIDDLVDAYVPAPSTRTQPGASPICATSTARCPKTLMVVAGNDPLRDEGIAFSGQLKASGVKSELLNYKDMIHGFMSLHGLFTEAQQAIEDVGAKFGALLRAGD